MYPYDYPPDQYQDEITRVDGVLTEEGHAREQARRRARERELRHLPGAGGYCAQCRNDGFLRAKTQCQYLAVNVSRPAGP